MKSVSIIIPRRIVTVLSDIFFSEKGGAEDWEYLKVMCELGDAISDPEVDAIGISIKDDDDSI